MKTLCSGEEARNPGLHIMEFCLYGLLKLKSRESEEIPHWLPGSEKGGGIQSAQQNIKVSFGMTEMLWNFFKKSHNCTLLNNHAWAGLAPTDGLSHAIG